MPLFMRDPLLCQEDLRRERHGALAIYLMPGIELAEVLDALDRSGELLKESRKGNVRRVGDWVVKESAPSLLGTIKRTIRRARYRQAWLSALHLRAKGVRVPEPIAFVETRRLGVISGHALITRYLQGHRDVERFAVGLVRRGAGRDTLVLFLDALAEAIRGVEAAGVWHADLSGKNILTADGAHFTFIDLDAAQPDTAYSEERRLKNHVQLYDSFCDFINDQLMVTTACGCRTCASCNRSVATSWSFATPAVAKYAPRRWRSRTKPASPWGHRGCLR